MIMMTVVALRAHDDKHVGDEFAVTPARGRALVAAGLVEKRRTRGKSPAGPSAVEPDDQGRVEVRAGDDSTSGDEPG